MIINSISLKFVDSYPTILRYVVDWLVTPKMLEVHYYLDFNYFYKLFASYNKCDQGKASEKEIYNDLMSISWYPLRWWGWCMSKDEEK